MRNSGALLLIVTVLHPCTHGQPVLNLERSEPPGAGTGAGALALADRLMAEAAGMGNDPVQSAGAALRRLSARLLTEGEGAGAPGSPRVILGRTLADRIAAIEAWLNARARPQDSPGLDLLASDAAAVLAAPSIENADLLARDLLAGLAHEAGPPAGASGWVELDPIAWPGVAIAADDWASGGLISPATAAALTDLDATLARADGWPVYQRSAARLRALLATAADAARPPAWVDATGRDALHRRFEEAAIDVANPESRTRGVASLEWLVAISAVTARADGLSTAPAAAVSVKRARAAIGQYLSVQAADPAEARRSLSTAERMLALVAADSELPSESQLVRHVRPAFRALLADDRASEPQVLAALPEALRRADAMSEPGTVAAVSRLQRAVDDLRLLVVISDAMIDPSSPRDREPAPRPDWEGVSSLVLAAGQAMGKPDLRDSALAELRTLGERIRGSMPIAGEAEMEAALAAGGEDRAAWSELTGGREGELPADIADRRRVWLASWGRRQFKESDAEGVRLDNLRRLLETLRDAAPVHAMLRATGPGPARDRYEALQAWPGWQLAPESLARLTDGLPARLSAATSLVLGPEQSEATARLESIRTDHAAALLAGRLMSQAAAHGYAPTTSAADALHELAAGVPVESGPGAAWLAGLRSTIADVCRYGEEIAAAELLNAGDRAASIRAYANRRAAEALSHLDETP